MGCRFALLFITNKIERTFFLGLYQYCKILEIVYYDCGFVISVWNKSNLNLQIRAADFFENTLIHELKSHQEAL